MIEDAIAFAAQAHQGQLDRLGEPYIFHALRVMMLVKDAGGSEAEIAAAALHDVVEDTDTTVQEIEQLFNPEVAVLVDAISRREGEDYVEYVERCVAAGPSAVRLKLADLTDNSNPQRLARVASELRAELEAKYRSGFDVIERAHRDAPLLTGDTPSPGGK
jgi:(p)ppGpp synthase/HD superfamily hydrolase